MGWADEVRHFSPAGDPELGDPGGDRMDPDLMRRLDWGRKESGRTFTVTDGWRSEADQDRLRREGQTLYTASAHPLGKGVDGYSEGWTLLEMYQHWSQYRFWGYGLYPFTKSGKPAIHLDTMDRQLGRALVWVRLKSGRYVYAPDPAFWAAWLEILRAGA